MVEFLRMDFQVAVVGELPVLVGLEAHPVGVDLVAQVSIPVFRVLLRDTAVVVELEET